MEVVALLAWHVSSGRTRGTTPQPPTWPSGPQVHSLFLLRLLITGGPGWCQLSFLGEVQNQPQICLMKLGVALVYDFWAAFAHSDTHTPSVPKFFCFLISFPTRAGPQFQVWPL